MSFEFRPAVRENVSLLIGLAGGTGSGKTFSAMRLAAGIAGGKRFAVIDTENGRARHYADQFDFDVADLTEPFRPDRYADAIEAATAYPVVVVDSMSHEHAGPGGLLEWHEEEFQRMGGRDAVKMTAWIKPKTEHKKMVSRLLRVKPHVILCFRAEEKLEQVTVDGKKQWIPKRSLTGADGWIPVCEKNLPYELTLSFLLTAAAPGLPKPIKLQEQHRPMVPLDRPVTEDVGVALAAWAAGEGTSARGGSPTAASSEEETPSVPVGDATAPSGFASQEDRQRMFSVAKAAGVGSPRVKEIVVAVTGQGVSAQIPASLMDDVIAAIEAEGVPA